jgi:hypothetical protein
MGKCIDWDWRIVTDCSTSRCLPLPPEVHACRYGLKALCHIKIKSQRRLCMHSSTFISSSLYRYKLNSASTITPCVLSPA